MLRFVVVAALAVVTGADSASDIFYQLVPRSRLSQQCAGYCKDSSKFSLQAGSTYVYNYEGTTTSGVPGSSNDTSEIRITAKAHIQVTARPCELILQVHEAQLFDSGTEGLENALRQKEFATALEENPLRFSFQDGRIEQLCPSMDESTWALNIKRGLLSVFQNSMVDFSKDAHLHERDISGTCETTYSVKPMMWSDVKVLRRKNLRSCSGRGHQTIGLPGTLSSKTKSVPVIRSEQFCEQTIRVGDSTYLSNAVCQESHVFAPFSNRQSGIRTSIKLSLSLDNIIQTVEPVITDLFVNVRTNLQFDFRSASSENSATGENVWDTLNQLISENQQGVGKMVPHLFDQLVSQLADLDDQQMVKLFDEQQDKRARQFLIDALPFVGSASSVKAMYQIHQAQQITQDELDAWLTSLAFLKQPTLDMLQTLNLFVVDKFHPKTWLAVSSVVHTYCQLDPACTAQQEVQNIISQIEVTLTDSCHSVTMEQHQNIIVALKAVGNIGFTHSLDTLRTCFMDDHNSLEVRLAAISATRRFSCSNMLQFPMLQLFQDTNKDVELRIAAYLAAIQCPTTSTISQLRDSLYQEDINQVLSFVWTHLTNLQESTSSWKRELRQMLQDNYLANKFKTDARKFSRNYEMSFYSDILNTGATVDSNIVFSTKSYLPRSATLNLTLDLFGEAVNLFEIGTRLEGFESMVEDVFSPKGYFPDESVQKMLKNMRTAENDKTAVIQSFSEEFTKGTNNIPQGTIFARVFGNELYLTQFTSLSKFLNPQTSNKYSFTHFMESLSSLFNNNNIDYTKSFKFINTKHVIPTILGLPLQVEVNGTATVGIQLNTEMDVNNILKTRSGNFALSVNPSATLQIDGKMIVNAVFTEAGVETKGSLSSNTYLDTKVKIDKGKIVDMFLNVPRDKVEIINVTSAVFVKHREKLVEIEGVGEVSKHDTCTGQHIPTISGMRACSQYRVLNASAVEDSPYFPLTGKFQYALALQKSDEFSYYQLHLQQLFETTDGKHSGKFVLEIDTPGSKLNRKLLADLSFNSKDGDANLELVSPVGSFKFSGKLGLTSAEKSLDLKALVDGQDYAAIKVALQTEHNARTIRYEPSFFLQARPNINFNITGRLDVIPGNKYSLDFTTAGFTKKPISFSGDISSTKGRYSGSLSAKAESMDIKVNGKVVNTPTVISCKTLVRYILNHDSMQGIDFAAKLQNHKKGSFTKKQLWVNLQMSELPVYSTKVAWILYRTQKYLDSNVDLTVGKTQWKSQQLYHNNMQEKNKNFQIVLSLESPTKNVDYRAEVQYKTADDTIHAHALAQLSKTNQFISQLDYEHSYSLHTLELEMATPWKRAYMEGKLESSPASDSEWENIVNGSVIVQWGNSVNPQWVSATCRYKTAETLLSAKHEVVGRLEGSEWEHPLLLEGKWTARSVDGLILSDSELAVVVMQATYKLDMGYTKDPSQGEHDLKVNLVLPDNTYSGNFLVINNQELKNLTVRLDLEKTVYFTSELRLWWLLDLQLFWNYLEDRSESVLIKYWSNRLSEVAVVSMPGHYALLTADKLGPGFSSMNITALWGESKGSANNAILLSTYWLFDMTPWYSKFMWLPTIRTHVHLTSPFIGFEQQSFVFNMNGSSVVYPLEESVTREIDASIRWQDQFINFEFDQQSNSLESPKYGLAEAHSKYIARIDSSVELVRNANVKIDLKDKQYGLTTGTFEKRYAVDAVYGNWAVFAFNSTYIPEHLSVLVDLTNKAEDKVLCSGELSIVKNSIFLKSTFPSNKKIVFTSIYEWPNNFVANLSMPLKGYEVSAFQYNLQVGEEEIDSRISGKVGEDFILLLTNFGKSQSGFKSVLNLSSSSSVPDVIIKLEHKLQKNEQDFNLREFASIQLIQDGEIVKSGRALLLLFDEVASISSKTKKVQTVLELPNHYSSWNYTYQTQVKVTGVEVQHYLSQSWNEDKTEVGLTHEGFAFITGFINRNDDKKVELFFKNSGNSYYRTDLALPGGYFVKNRLSIRDYLAWENFILVSTPSRKVIVKNLQTVNGEKTDFVHKSTVSLDKEVAFLDFVINFDPKTKKLDSVIFSTTTPWNHPVMAKYDPLIDTGATMKHEIQLKYKEDKEIKALFDVTSTEMKHSVSFNVYSPYCKDFGGTLELEDNEIISKFVMFLNVNEKRITTEMELVKNFENPSFLMEVKNSDEKIIRIFFNYDIGNTLKQSTLSASYFEQEIKLHGQYSVSYGNVKVGFNLNSPFSNWKSISLDFDSMLSQTHSMFEFNAKKDEKYIIVSGSGRLMVDLLKTDLLLEHALTGEPKKYSSAFEYSKEVNSDLVSFSYKHNEVDVLDFNIKWLREDGKKNGQSSYTLSYNSNTPIESFKDSSLNIKFIENDNKHKIDGNINVNKWKATIKGENAFDLNGTGYLDMKLEASNFRVEFYVKHAVAEKDAYTWYIMSNNEYSGGSITLSNTNGQLEVEFDLETSFVEMKSINGFVLLGTTSYSYTLESATNVNGKRYVIKYKVSFEKGYETKTQHDLWVSVPIEPLKIIRGTLGYGKDSLQLPFVKGEITDGNTTSKIIFITKGNRDSNSLNVDLSGVLTLSFEKSISDINLVVKSTPSQVIPKFFMDLSMNQTFMAFETDNDLTGKVQFTGDVSKWGTLSVTGVMNDLNATTVLEIDTKLVKLDFVSNIKNWSELSVLIKHKDIDVMNEKYSISVSKEREELLYLSIEGYFNRLKGNRLIYITTQKFYMDMNVNYDLSSNFFAGLKYNINGNRQQAEGKISFLPGTTRIDLATPIKGFEDMTLISSMNKKDKKVGLIFQKNGKTLGIDLSATVEKQLIVLNGSLVNGQDQYIISVGAQNGSADEPMSMSAYINAFKNKRSVFWLSLEGSYDLEKKSGVKVSFSSYYYKHLLFELLSLRHESKHALLFNYMYGIDIVYSLNAVVIKDFYRPELVIDSQFGPYSNYLKVNCDFTSPEKIATGHLRQNQDRFVYIAGSASFSMLASSLKFTLENQDILNAIDNITVSGEYNFEGESSINSSFILNGVKYFDLAIESQSIYEIEFYSSLVPSNYISTSYDITLIYRFHLPNISTYSNVNINGDYYKSSANITWSNDLVDTFFQLTTNAGYGFENAVLSAKYNVGNHITYSHLIYFTVDDSKLFHIASDITYPNHLAINLILPDSLFLPFVKEIGIVFSFTDEKKLFSFKYISGSSENRKFDFLFNLEGHQCILKLGRFELSSEDVFRVDNFECSYSITENVLDLYTSVAWENNNIFSASYNRKPLVESEIKDTLLRVFLGIENVHTWNITVVHGEIIQFLGILNPTNVLLNVKHPTSLYHNYYGLSELVYTKTFGSKKILQAHYKSEHMVELEFKYSGFDYYGDQMVKNVGIITSFTDLTIKVKDKDTISVTVYGETTCEQNVSTNSLYCPMLKFEGKITGIAKKPLSWNLFVDVIESKVQSVVTTATQDYTFGGKFQMNSDLFICSNFQAFFGSSNEPKRPFTIKYETNCKDYLYGRLNFFEEDGCEIRANLNYQYNRISDFKVQSTNILFYNELQVSGEIADHVIRLNANLDKDVFQIQLHQLTSNYSLTVQSSYVLLKNLELSMELDISGEKCSGKFKIEGVKASAEWIYNISFRKNRPVVCHIDINKDIQVDMEFDISDKKELILKLNRSGRLYEGKGAVVYVPGSPNLSGIVTFAMDGEKYELSFERFMTSQEHKGVISLKTSDDVYYIDLYMNKKHELNSTVLTIKYKTPFYPLDYADLSIKCSQTQVNAQEYVSIKELERTEENYNVSYNKTVIDMSLKTSNINWNDVNLVLTYGDLNKYGVLFNYLSKKVEITVERFKNNNSYAFQSSVDVNLDMPDLQYLEGKSLLRIYANVIHRDALASLEAPFTKNILATIKLSRSYMWIEEDERIDNEFEFYGENNSTLEIMHDKNSIFKLASYKNSNGIYKLSVYSEWKNENSLKFNYNIEDLIVNCIMQLEMVLRNKNETVIDTLYRYSREETYATRILHELDVSKFFSVEEFRPKVFFTREINEAAIAQYQLNFTSRSQSENLAFDGNFTLNLPDLKSFSINSNPSIHASIFVESFFNKYDAKTDFFFQHNKMDGSVQWRRIYKSELNRQDPQYTDIKFGGFVQRNSAEIYLNNNKMSGSLNSSRTQTTISAQLVNEKSKKNITVFASVQYSPVFLLSISHTVFDSPCSIEIKVDRKSQSVESAVTIVYNSLEQQAFVNVYLDSNPRYAELMYIDIWQQTHEASIHMEEKDNEVTVRGKINSPALDENFMIVTIGCNNDKFDLNLNDAIIFKAFKENTFGLLNLIILGNDYKLQYRYENEMEISIILPQVNGVVTFDVREINEKTFLQASFDVENYNFLLNINKNNIFNIVLTKESENILQTKLEIEKDSGMFKLQFQCDILDYINSFSIKHKVDPILLVVSLNSPYFLGSNLEIVFGMQNADLLTGIFEIRQQVPLFKSYLALSKENKTVDVTIEAPLFTEMDKTKISGVFNTFSRVDYELKLSASLSSKDNTLFNTSIYFVKNEEILTSGLIVKSKLKNYEDLIISFHLPRHPSRDMKVHFIAQLPSFKPCELSVTLCYNEEKIVGSALAKWQDLFVSFEYKNGVTPFYADMYEWNVQYLKTKILIGAWMKPKQPLTDYIYFVDVNEKRIIEISHALILQQNHFKSKFIVETAMTGHEKYGIDLELQNLKIGKIIRLLVSVPQLGKDLGIDFGYSYESMLNYALLAQMKIPYDNEIKTARIYALHKIHPSLNLSKLNYTLECSTYGTIGWDFEIQGSAPFVWQGKMSTVESKLNLNGNVYFIKTKSYLQSNQLQLSFGLETPFESIRKGELNFSGTQQLIGSELVVSLNSNELINVNITEDKKNEKQIKVLSKWRNLVVRYLYELDDGFVLNGYICWELFQRNTSQFGVSVNTRNDNQKYEISAEMILPSVLIPKLSIKTAYENNINDFFSLVQVDFPGLVLEGKLANEIASNMHKSGIQIKWAANNNAPKNIGMFYVTEKNIEEIKHYFTIQHFALNNDLMLTVYAKNSLYGVNMQYSPLKEEEITLEFGYWLVEDSEKEKSGVKVVALHPATQTLIYGVANITCTSEFIEAGLSVAYLPKLDSSKVTYVEIYGKKNRKLPEVFIGCTSNGNSLVVGGSIWEKENYLRGLTLEARVNQKDPFKLEIVQSTANPSIEAELSYSLSRTYRLFAGIPNDNELTAKLSHTVYGRPNLDALATLRLNTSRILWGRFELPSITQIGQEFYSGIVEEYSDIILVSQAMSNSFTDFVQEDFSKNIVLLLDAVSTQTDVLMHQTYLEVEIISKSFIAMKNIVHRVYDENHFYVKTCHQFLKRMSSTVYGYTSCAVEVVGNVMESLFGPLLDVTARVWEVLESVISQYKMFIKELGFNGNSPIKQVSDLVSNYQTLRNSLVQHAKQTVAFVRTYVSLLEQRSADLLSEAEISINQLIQSIEQAVAIQIQRVINYKDTILAGFSVFGKTIEGMIDIVKDGIHRIKEVRYTINWAVKIVDRFNSWYTNFRLESCLREIDLYIEKVINLITSDIEKNFGEYEVYFLKAKHILAGHYDELNDIPQINYIKNTAEHIYQKIKWFWNYAKLNERLKDAVKKYLENMKAALDELEDQLDQKDGELRSEYFYNAENNSLTFTQELPFEWRGFNQLPEYNMYINNPRHLAIPAQEYSNMVQTMANYLWQDAKLLPYLLPPFGADALISGNSFITFDNTFYHFNSNCNSYLLASDLYHNTFSLIMSYSQQNKRDLLLIVKDVEILVKNNLEVYVNGVLEDLPLKLDNEKLVTLERKAHSVLIKSDDGFSLECSSFQDLCKFHLDGWYIGKTAGLLGTYNNEPSDDLVNPSRQLSQNLRQFTDSWVVKSESCNSEEERSSSSEDTSSYESMCELFFSSQSSPFFPCFHVVDPEAFHTMCLSSSKRDNTCSSVLAYLTKCTSSGVQLWMPEFCTDSSIKDVSSSNGYSDIIEVHSKMAADIVFIVETAACVENTQLDLGTVVTSLNSDLVEKGITENQFAFISFGNEDSQIQTINGQIWTDDEKLLPNVLRRLEITDESTSSYNSALDLAASLPFRPSASKVVILIHCSSCSHNENYGGVLERFNQNDITLHILQKENIMGKKGKLISKAIGLEKNGAYPRKRLSKNNMPNSQLLEQVSVPQDLCTPIMINTNGTLFNLDVTKKALRTWTGRVAQGAIPPTFWKQCENSVGLDNIPSWRCRSTSQNKKLRDWDQTTIDEYMDTSRSADLYTEYEEVER